MLTISSALQQQQIKDLFHEQSIEGITYTYVKKEGINLMFEVSGDNLDEVVSITKKAIKATPFGAALFFRVTI